MKKQVDDSSYTIPRDTTGFHGMMGTDSM